MPSPPLEPQKLEGLATRCGSLDARCLLCQPANCGAERPSQPMIVSHLIELGQRQGDQLLKSTLR